MNISDSSFCEMLRYEDVRPSDSEDVRKLALEHALSSNVSENFRVASAVIYIYKSLELEKEVSIHAEDFIGISMHLSKGRSVRNDAVQLQLSIITAQWHMHIANNEHARFAKALKKIASYATAIIDGVIDGKPSYSFNISIALALMCFINFKKKNVSHVDDICITMLKFYKKIQEGISIDTPPAHFKDTLKCGEAVKFCLEMRAHLKTGKGGEQIIKTTSYGDVANKYIRIKGKNFKEKFKENIECVARHSPSGGPADVKID